MRNLDISALRSFVMVADLGGVTRAANTLNRTQSAVSMQLKRLEEVFDRPLLEKSGRTVRPTPEGELLVSYARRLLALNDETWRRMTNAEFDGQVTLGVPHDIVNPVIPRVLKRLRRAFPRVRVNLDSSFTAQLKERFNAGTIDIILTTEVGVDAGGETLVEKPLVWVGAEGGSVWNDDPVPLAFERVCAFRVAATEALDAQGRAWKLAIDTQSESAVYATIAADFAIFTQLSGMTYPGLAAVPDNSGLPELPTMKINLYISATLNEMIASVIAQYLRQEYAKADAEMQSGSRTDDTEKFQSVRDVA